MEAKYAWILAVLTLSAWAKTPDSTAKFPVYMTDGFDYASFTRFDAASAPRNLIYQSNGFMALQESGFGGQRLIVPVSGPQAPVNEGEREIAAVIDAPVFVDSSGKSYRMEDASEHSVTYFADRTIYRAKFAGDLDVNVIAYPVYGRPSAVIRIVVLRAKEPVWAQVECRPLGFQALTLSNTQTKSYGSSRWPYRLLLSTDIEADIRGSAFRWKLTPGGSAAVLISMGKDGEDAEASLADLRSSKDLFDAETHRRWNEYLSSAPLVAPAEPFRFTIGTLNKEESIAPEDLVRSELWFWRGVLNTTCQAHYLPACPMVVADWNVFMGMWSNDGIAESIALMGTNRSDLARSSILSWFRYALNSEGDGTQPWTIFPSGKSTVQAMGPERFTQGVPVMASLVGEYVRLTGDTSLLDAKPGGVAGDRTVWEALVAYQRNLPKIRDMNHDHLIDWMHTYETGWDDKDSPFIDLKGHPTSSINEQADNLWSLQEMVYLAKIKGEDTTPWEQEFDLAMKAVREKLWDPQTQRYWDLDVETGKLWTQGENMDAYYWLYFETDPARIAAMMKRLNDPAKFNGPLIPTLAFDTPNWGGYWRGPAWPREFGYVGIGLAHCGHAQEGFEWLARAIHANYGPILPENVDPKSDPPGEHPIGSVRIMGHDTLDTLLFPEVAGLETWAGEDLTVVPSQVPGRVYVRNQKWMGDRYDAILEPNKPTQIIRNGVPLAPLEAGKTWVARKSGSDVHFEPR